MTRRTGRAYYCARVGTGDPLISGEGSQASQAKEQPQEVENRRRRKGISGISGISGFSHPTPPKIGGEGGFTHVWVRRKRWSGVVPMPEQAPQLTLTADTLRTSTDKVLCKRWKPEQFEVYMELRGTPGRVTLDEQRLRRVANGNPTPLEWRLSEEYGSECSVRGDLCGLVKAWLASVDEFTTHPRGGRDA